MSSNSIMIIDDDADDRMIFNEGLSRADSTIKFYQASNGPDGINFLLNLEHLPDYLFVDVNMPNMNGFEVLTKIKSHEKLKDIKVIIYTTSSHKSAIESARNLGANGFLTKPEQISELTLFIKKLLSDTGPGSFIGGGFLFVIGPVCYLTAASDLWQIILN